MTFSVFTGLLGITLGDELFLLGLISGLALPLGGSSPTITNISTSESASLKYSDAGIALSSSGVPINFKREYRRNWHEIQSVGDTSCGCEELFYRSEWERVVEVHLLDQLNAQH